MKDERISIVLPNSKQAGKYVFEALVDGVRTEQLRGGMLQTVRGRVTCFQVHLLFTVSPDEQGPEAEHENIDGICWRSMPSGRSESLLVCSVWFQIPVAERGELVRQGELIVCGGARRKRAGVRSVFLYQHVVVFTKQKTLSPGRTNYSYKHSIKVRRPHTQLHASFSLRVVI